MGRVKEQNVAKDHKQCLTCQYRGLAGAMLCCDYILIVGHSKGCKGGNGCSAYIKGDKIPCKDIDDYGE